MHTLYNSNRKNMLQCKQGVKRLYKMDNATIIIYLIILAYAGIFIIAPVAATTTGLILAVKYSTIRNDINQFRRHFARTK